MKIPAVLAVSTAALLSLSACGSAASGTTASPGDTTSSTKAGIHSATTSLGTVLVDGRGMTLYVLSADGQNHSTCVTQCLQFWPAVTPTHSKLAVETARTTTPDGTAIATVAGHPVYTFALDHQPGDVNGEGVSEFGGTWTAISPTGTPVSPGGAQSSPSSSSSSSSSSGRGYAY